MSGASTTGGSPPLVVKFGGELLEDALCLQEVVSAIASVRAGGKPLVVVHGGGKEIDRALQAAGIEKRQVDGLRVTDGATLEVVVSVLAGTVNTRFVAALTTAEVPAVGLTGADGGCGLVGPAPPHRTVDGRLVDLGRVGVPIEGSSLRVIGSLVRDGFVPVLACIGLGRDGRLFNVNADTLAGHLASGLGASRLVIAGTTPGVVDDSGSTLRCLSPHDIERLIGLGTATAGMVAKLRACAQALAGGVRDVVIVDGRDRERLVRAAFDAAPEGATVVARGN